MEVAFAFFAEAAQITSDGRLNVLGADLRALQGSFPVVVQSVAFVAKVELDSVEREGVHHFTGQMMGPDGAAIEPRIVGEYTAPAPVKPELKAAFTVVFRIMGMVFPSPGTYTFQISVDGRELKRLRLRLTEAQEQPNAKAAQEEALAR
jgi:hypothetical protein